MRIRANVTVKLANDRMHIDYKFAKGAPLLSCITELAFNLDARELEKLQTVIQAMRDSAAPQNGKEKV